jgi:hypothetical protein
MVLITGNLKGKWKRARVRPVHIGRRLYLVESSTPGTWYPVRLMVSETGAPLGECGCMSGQLDRECRHVIAAGLLAHAIKRASRAAERGAR